MASEKEIKPRPYWHVDMKWIFGILSTLFLFLSLLLYTLSNLTAEKTAIPLATLIVANQFSKNGLDDSADVEIVKKQFLATNQEFFYPFEGNKNVKVSRSDIENLSPKELRLKIFRQVVEPFYLGNVDEKTKQQAGALAFLNKETNNTLSRLFFISIIPTFLFLTGLILFSYRYGRLVSPAVVFLQVATIPAIFLFIIQNARPDGKSGGAIPFLPQDVTVELARTLSQPFNVLFITGILLLLTTLIMKLFTKLKTNN